MGDLGPRRLTTVHAIGQSLAIGPMFSAGLISGVVANAAGFNTPLSVLLGFAGALGLAYVVSVYARRYAGAGAIYEYLARGMRNSFGIFSAGVYIIGMMFLGAGGIYIGIGFLTQGFFDAHLSADVPWWLGGAVALAIVLALNHFGVRIAIRGVLALAAISAVPFVVLAIVIIADGGADGNTLAVFDPGETSWNSVFTGVLYAVTLFIGFEASAAIAEETHTPRRSIPVAVLGTVAISGVFYLLVTYAATIGFGRAALAENAWFGSPSPMGVLADQYVGQWLAVVIDLVIVLDALSLAIAIMVAVSRIVMALARDGLLPRAMAATSRHATPLAGNLVVAGASVAMLLFGSLTSYGGAVELPNEIAAFNITAATGSYLVQLIYVFLALVALRLVWPSWWRLLVTLAGLATPILAFKGSLDPWPTYPNNRGVIFAVVAIGITLAWWLVLRFSRPREVETAAAHASA